MRCGTQGQPSEVGAVHLLPGAEVQALKFGSLPNAAIVKADRETVEFVGGRALGESVPTAFVEAAEIVGACPRPLIVPEWWRRMQHA